jgi:hypothetical protein
VAAGTEGNLSRDGRHLTVVSKDRDLLESLTRCLVLDNRIADKYNRGRRYYRLQWSDRTLYDGLVRLGLHPAKSLTLGELAIPDACSADFFRGWIDGDGSILTYSDRSKNRRRRRLNCDEQSRKPQSRLQTPVRQAGVAEIAQLDVLFADRPVSRAQAREGGRVSFGM